MKGTLKADISVGTVERGRHLTRRIPEVCEDMKNEMGESRYYEKSLAKMAQFELTLLDVNNSVPKYIYDEDTKGKFDYDIEDTFMGFHIPITVRLPSVTTVSSCSTCSATSVSRTSRTISRSLCLMRRRTPGRKLI